jgi:hypothetical protein
MVSSKLFVNQWRSESSFRGPPGHSLAFTKSADEPTIFTHKTAVEGEHEQIAARCTDLKGSMELLADRNRTQHPSSSTPCSNA